MSCFDFLHIIRLIGVLTRRQVSKVVLSDPASSRKGLLELPGSHFSILSRCEIGRQMQDSQTVTLKELCQAFPTHQVILISRFTKWFWFWKNLNQSISTYKERQIQLAPSYSTQQKSNSVLDSSPFYMPFLCSFSLQIFIEQIFICRQILNKMLSCKLYKILWVN